LILQSNLHSPPRTHNALPGNLVIFFHRYRLPLMVVNTHRFSPDRMKYCLKFPWLANQRPRVSMRLRLLVMVSLACSGGVQAQSPEPDQKKSSEYVGSLACAECHKEIFNNYSRTAMGRSMSDITDRWLSTNQTSGQVVDKENGLKLEVFAKDGRLYQSEVQFTGDDKGAARETRQMEWIIGAGENGFGALLKNGDYVFQAPLSYYSKVRRWELSPGYENGNAGFNRPILPGCISCHSGRPNVEPEETGRFRNPAFSELAIGCENCHGPGLSHLVAAKTEPGSYQGHDGTIVNPASLPSALADNICISCHQTGDVRVLKPGRRMSDFRPGTPLDDTLSILMVPPKEEAPPQQDLLEHYYSMTLSKCYRSSGEKLGCISCHDPHVEPVREEVPAYFKAKCLACHTEKSCTLALDVRRTRHPADDCAGCHMQKREVKEISHSSITNHRILARADEPFPADAFRQTTPALPDLIHLNPAPGRKPAPPPAIVLLEAYGELSEQHPEYLDRYHAILAQLERTSGGDPMVEAAVGNRDLHQGRYQDAVNHLQNALLKGPPKTILYTDLADALVKLDRAGEAAAVLQKATGLDPFNAQLRKRLIVELIQLKDYPHAKLEMEDYVQRFPMDTFMLQMLTRVNVTERPN